MYKVDADPNDHNTPPTKTWKVYAIRVVHTGLGTFDYEPALLGTCDANDDPPYSYSSDDTGESELLTKPNYLNAGVIAIRAVSGAETTNPIYLTLRPGATYHIDIKVDEP